MLRHGQRSPFQTRRSSAPSLVFWRFTALCALSCLCTAPATAQQNDEEEDRPRVHDVTFRGVESVEHFSLKEAIYTQATRCRGILVQPLCWISNSPLWKERHDLNRLELSRDELRIRVFYFRRGWRDAQVRAEVRPRNAGVEVVFHVDEGEPTRVAAVDVRQETTVLEPGEIRGARLPREGDPLDLLRLDSAVTRLREALLDRAYLDAEVRDTVRVDAEARIASIDVALEPGRRATVGEIDIDGAEEVEERVIRVRLDLREGSLLRARDVRTSQRNLFESNLFRLVRVIVPEQADTAKRVEVQVDEAHLRELRLAGGFNTVDFAQLETRFTHYNFMGGGRLLTLHGTLGNLLAHQLNGQGIFTDVTTPAFLDVDRDRFLAPTWQASATFSQRAFRSDPRNTLSSSLFTHRRTVPGVAIDRGYGASLTFTRQVAWRTPASASYQFEITSVEAGDVYYCIHFGVCDPLLISSLRDGQRLSPVTLTLNSDRADDPISPTEGLRARISAEHASAATASDFRYHRVSAEYAHYLRVGRGGVIAGRVGGGWVRALESTGEAIGIGAGAVLHPRKRFYSGGSRSVRGYGENQLGPRILTIPADVLTDPELEGHCTDETIADRTCDPSAVPSDAFQPRPLGGNLMIEGNLELRRPLFGELVGAVFVDAGWVGGEASLIETASRGAITPGFGIRYQSPVGPIRVDLGVRPSLTEELRVATEFVENGESRIVILREPKRFSPVEDAGGIRQVLNRLMLHLSIGQAF